VMAGDPQQLAPTILSPQAKELGKSLFERLLEDHGEPVKQLLKEQHRFPTALMEFPSREIYGGQLRAHASVANEKCQFLFIDTAGKSFDESSAPGSQSLHNEGEAGLIVDHARGLLAQGLELGIIT